MGDIICLKVFDNRGIVKASGLYSTMDLAIENLQKYYNPNNLKLTDMIDGIVFSIKKIQLDENLQVIDYD